MRTPIQPGDEYAFLRKLYEERIAARIDGGFQAIDVRAGDVAAQVDVQHSARAVVALAVQLFVGAGPPD